MGRRCCGAQIYQEGPLEGPRREYEQPGMASNNIVPRQQDPAAPREATKQSRQSLVTPPFPYLPRGQFLQRGGGPYIELQVA